MKKTKKTEKEEVQLLEIPPIEMTRAMVELIGDSTSSLVVQKMSEKMKNQLAAKEENRARNKRPPRKPKQEYEDSMHTMPGSRGTVYAVPCRWVKGSMVSACRLVEGISMQSAKVLFTVMGVNNVDYAEIVGSAPKMHSDIVLVGGKGPHTGNATMRYRGEFKKWKIVVIIEYRSDIITLSSLINLLMNAGRCGLGEMRPEKSGLAHGTYSVGKITVSKKSKKVG